MSRSNPDNFLRNPAKHFIKFEGSGEEGKGGFFSYYDKENETNVTIDPDEFEMIALEWKLFCVRGFSKSLDAYCYSNEVRTINDKIVIRNFKSEKSKADVVLEGTYSEMKGDEGTLQQSKKTAALKYNRCVYFSWKETLMCVHLQGRTLSSWMEDIEKFSTTKMMTHKIRIKEIKHDINGDVEYTYATFEFGDKITDDENEAATAMDVELQKYLAAYLSKNGNVVDPALADTGGEDEGEKPKEKDPSEWRMFDMGGKEMSNLNIFEIRELVNSCHEAGGRAEMKDKHYYDCLVFAEREYDKAAETALETKDKKGKKLEDYTIDELKEISKMLIEKRPHDPARLKVEAAWEIKVLADDIPF